MGMSSVNQLLQLFRSSVAAAQNNPLCYITAACYINPLYTTIFNIFFFIFSEEAEFLNSVSKMLHLYSLKESRKQKERFIFTF